MLCLWVIMQQTVYDVISALHRNVTVGHGRRLIPGVTMAEHACSSFSIKNDNGSEVCSPVNSLRENQWILFLLYYLCSCLVQAWVEVLFEPKRSTGKYSVDHKATPNKFPISHPLPSSVSCQHEKFHYFRILPLFMVFTDYFLDYYFLKHERILSKDLL